MAGTETSETRSEEMKGEQRERLVAWKSSLREDEGEASTKKTARIEVHGREKDVKEDEFARLSPSAVCLTVVESENNLSVPPLARGSKSCCLGERRRISGWKKSLETSERKLDDGGGAVVAKDRNK